MPGFGRFTQIDLNDLAFLKKDGAVFDREAARFGLELAAVAYDFDVDRWMDAGWTDITIQADERLLGGVALQSDAPRPLYQRIKNEVLPLVARRYIKSEHRLRQIRGLVWKPAEREEDPQTGKAITMIRRLPDGRHAVAVGFMGTGRRQVDWFSNFRFAHPEGFHEGFLALTEQYEENCDRVSFEQTARQLQLGSLTLQDIIQECQRPDSRFVLFAAGHSQGAAILQLWVHRLLQAGVLPRNILGYGYAPPSVAAFHMQGLDDAPLHLISNSDDIVTRVGLYRHIGHNHLFEADDAFRALCYQGHDRDPLFMRMLQRTSTFTGTQDSMRFLIAYIDALKRLPRSQAADALSIFAGGVQEMVLRRTTEPLEGLLRMLGRVTRRNYEVAMQAPVNEELVRALAVSLEAELLQEGAERCTRTLTQVMAIPHKLVFRDDSIPGLAPYTAIVVREYARLRDAE